MLVGLEVQMRRAKCRIHRQQRIPRQYRTRKITFFPNSSSVLLTDAEVSGISKDQLRIGRNEILARHGRRFNDQTLQQYFDSKSWYNGTISPDEFDANLDSRLNDVERANIEIIKKYE